jgi:hypothetical protein
MGNDVDQRGCNTLFQHFYYGEKVVAQRGGIQIKLKALPALH